jgi:serine/threonine protein kinase
MLFYLFSSRFPPCHLLGGTPCYLSPEQLDGKLTNGYTRVVDWWSYGILLYELLVGKTPFSRGHGESHYEIFLRILKSKISFPFSFDSKSRELVSSLCHANIDKRLCDAASIKSHPYYEMPWEMVELKKLVPPFVPKLKDEGDAHYFRTYSDSGLPPNYKSENDANLEQQYFFDF